MFKIKELDPKQWKNYKLLFSYDTDGYYSFEVHNWDFKLIFCSYPTVIHKTFTDRLFGEWLENPIAFGAFYHNHLIGVIECFHESWNNRFRITNLLVWDDFRNQGIGKLLIQKAEEAAKRSNARMLVLETQTCNRKAVDFYLAMGFHPIGFDLFCYTNSDPDSGEVRLEMAKPLI